MKNLIRKQKTNKSYKIKSPNVLKLLLKQKRGNNKVSNAHGSIAVKLIATFMIPVCFAVIIGFVSYSKASKSIVQKYRESSLQTIAMTGEYFRFGFDSVEAAGMQYVVDDQIKDYFNGNYDNDQASLAAQNIKKVLSAKNISDEFINNIHIISNDADTMTTASKSGNNMYSEFLKTAAGRQLSKKSSRSYWVGSDDYLDKTFDINKNEYALRYIRGFITGKACVIIDIKSSTLKSKLDNYNFGKGSMVGFVTEDGRELYATNTKPESNSNQIFSTEDFYQQSVQDKNNSQSMDITYNGEKYLYLYSKVGDTGAMICTLIPEATILDQVSGIKQITIILVALSCLIAIIVGLGIASGIQRTIRYFIGELKSVAEGNLTVRLKVKRKDEFAILSEGVNDMIDKMSGLIEKVKVQSSSVAESSEQMTKASKVFTKSTQGISDSVKEIQMGVTQQAEDAENCLHQMDSLSEKIQIVSGRTTEISDIAADTKSSVTIGIESMGTLNTKANETTKITEQIKSHIEVLEDKSKSIGKIIGTINDIANQTNLLSLNASIEAARAGIYGRGFTVVAEEIGKLAEQSVHAVKEIEGLIKEIQAQTKNAVVVANKADSIVADQEDAVNNTEKSFQTLSINVEKLIHNVGLITDSISNIDKAREGTLSAIENISAVSQQTAAGAISVYNSTNEQLEVVQSLNDLSKELDDNAQALENVVCQFVLD